MERVCRCASIANDVHSSRGNARASASSCNARSTIRREREIDGKAGQWLLAANGLASNENKMSDGGRERASLGVEVWKSSQKWSAQRSAVRSIAWLDLVGHQSARVRP